MNKILKAILIIVCAGGIYMISIKCPNEFSFQAVIDQENTKFTFATPNNENPNLAPAYQKELKLKIPAISHHIWLTSADKPKEINPIDLNHILNTLKILDAGELKWQHILWTNLPNLIPETVKKLQATGMEIKNVKELKNELLQDDIDLMIKQKSFSEASDLIRYMALQEYGGVYNDTDYEIFKPIDGLMQLYDFIGAEHHYFYDQKDGSFDTIGSAFVAASKANPIINQTVKLITRNHHEKNLPDYIKYSCTKHNQILVKAGPMALTIAFYQEGDHPEANNVIFNAKYFYHRCEDKELKDNSEAFGCHDLNGNWFGESVKN